MPSVGAPGEPLPPPLAAMVSVFPPDGVSVTFEPAASVHQEGVVVAPEKFPKRVEFAVIASAKLWEGVVVGLETEVVNSGERLPELKLDTPVPAAEGARQT